MRREQTRGTSSGSRSPDPGTHDGRWREGRERARPRPVDALAPAAIAVLAVVELLSVVAHGRLGAGVVEVAACALLVLRRTWPLLVGTLAGVACSLPPWFGPALDEIATPILVAALASYSLGRWIDSYVGLLGLLVTLMTILGDYVLVDLRAHDIADVVFVLSLLLPPYVFGRMTRALAQRGELLRRQQELVRREAIRLERDRIARELHDVIAHSVSAMVVQVAAAQDLVRSDPERAAAVLDRVAATGRRALAETGDLLHVIRDTEDELGLRPTVGLGSLDELVEEFRGDGLVVDLEVRGLPGRLPAGVDVSAYRIVRELLTNALRYAEDRAVDLQVAATRTELSIRASNLASGRSGLGSGLGLAGLRERVELLGGTLAHGTRPENRFEVSARLPLAEEPA